MVSGREYFSVELRAGFYRIKTNIRNYMIFFQFVKQKAKNKPDEGANPLICVIKT